AGNATVHVRSPHGMEISAIPLLFSRLPASAAVQGGALVGRGTSPPAHDHMVNAQR
ncbi:unnamed protein product, partial [marine sediment metagenome]